MSTDLRQHIVLLWITFMCVAGKLVHNHIDWKSNNGETMVYAVKTVQSDDLESEEFLTDLYNIGLVYTSNCLYIESCHIFTHNYHAANGTCVFSNTTCAPTVKSTKEVLHNHLENLDKVEWYAEIWERHRYKRRIEFDDRNYTYQWHLHAGEIRSHTDHHGAANLNHVHLNVTGVWELGVTGHNVTVAVVDDGLEWDNPDLKDNYNPAGSIDLNDNDNDPMPNEKNGQTLNSDHNEHGTRCAGEIAAIANNGICGVGIAYHASVSGVRALDGSMTDLLERDAFAAKHAINDIYSCSWGPEDDGKTVDGPHTLAKASIRNGILRGRHGYGSIYVVASGNGGQKRDNCNFDGYANSIYFVTIGAVNETGKKPAYAEDCASMLAVTPSGDGRTTGIVTTDVTHRAGSKGCTDKHSGTSAAAPMAAGVIALVLSVNPCITWRDVQHLIVLSSVKVDPHDSDWVTNAANLHHSHKHGFGLMSAWNIVNAAKIWKQMPSMSSFTAQNIHVSVPIRGGTPLTLEYRVGINDLSEHNLNILEYVEVSVTITHKRRGDLKIELICPNREYSSILASPRPLDDSTKGFEGWTFSTVRCWGERAAGRYILRITDTREDYEPDQRTGTLLKWSLTLHGSHLTYEQYQQRIREVHNSFSGEALRSNTSLTCEPPPTDIYEPQSSLPTKLLQIIVVIGSFITIAAIFNFIEDSYKKSRGFTSCLPSETNTHSVYHSDDIEDNSPHLNTDRHNIVKYDNHQFNVNIPIVHKEGNSATTSVAASNSDNEFGDEDVGQSETAALLQSS